LELTILASLWPGRLYDPHHPGRDGLPAARSTESGGAPGLGQVAHGVSNMLALVLVYLGRYQSI